MLAFSVPYMKKSTAYKLFGNDPAAMAQHVGVNVHRVHQWPKQLSKRSMLMVLGARVLLNARIKQHQGQPLDELEAELVAEE